MCSFHVMSEWCCSELKIDTAMGWKFYLEQYHFEITWNERKKVLWFGIGGGIRDYLLLKNTINQSSTLCLQNTFLVFKVFAIYYYFFYTPCNFCGKRTCKYSRITLFLWEMLLLRGYIIPIFNTQWTLPIKGCPRGVMVKAMVCEIVARKFKLQLRYYIHFWTNTLGKGMNPLILPAMG